MVDALVLSPRSVRDLYRVALTGVLLLAGHSHAQVPTAVEAVGDAIVFQGQINTRSAAEFLRLLQDPKVARLVITSRGGMVTAALDMAAAIHARQLDLEVPVACHSSCANYIFPAARNKLVRPGAVAWHGNMTHVLYLQQTGQANWGDEEMAAARQLAAREAEFYKRIGVDGFVAWFAKLVPYSVEDFYWLSAGDMQRFGIGNVTELDSTARAPDDQQLRRVQVDWAGLDAIRQAVRLDP